MTTQEAAMHAEPRSSHPEADAADLVIEPALDQETVARLAYYYWQERGCQSDSPDEDWFRAEAELRDLLPAGATG